MKDNREINSSLDLNIQVLMEIMEIRDSYYTRNSP